MFRAAIIVHEMASKYCDRVAGSPSTASFGGAGIAATSSLAASLEIAMEEGFEVPTCSSGFHRRLASQEYDDANEQLDGDSTRLG